MSSEPQSIALPPSILNTGRAVERVAGKVKFYLAKKGYGFIYVGPNHPDVFVHAVDLPEGVEALQIDQPVTFQLVNNSKGPRAINIMV